MDIDELIEERKLEAAGIVRRIKGLDDMIARLQKERAGLVQKGLMHNGAMEVLNTLKAQQAKLKKSQADTETTKIDEQEQHDGGN
jgi:hypothetical protein